jgi:hypothetical protein
VIHRGRWLTMWVAVVYGFTLMGCDEGRPTPTQSGPVIHRNIGIVRSVDWHERSVVIEEDKTHIVFTLRSCHGEMPFWVGEHIDIRYHAHEYLTGCQDFDSVARVGEDVK